MKTVRLFFCIVAAFILSSCSALKADPGKLPAPTDTGAYVTSVFVLTEDSKAVYVDKNVAIVCYEARSSVGSTDLLFMCYTRDKVPDFLRNKFRKK